jgi:carbonic anhydrase
MFYNIAALSIALLGAFTADAAGGSGWDYDHVTAWGDVEPLETNHCDRGGNSPIAFYTSTCSAPEANYKFDPGTCGIEDYTYDVKNNAVQMTRKADCVAPTVKIPNIGPKYYHAQTHIHLSSEHSIDGGYFGAEMHMVHLREGTDTNYRDAAVVGTMITPTATANNPVFEAWLQKWIEHMNTDATCDSCWGEPAVEPYDMNVYRNFIGKDFYHYNGGLTTPPCTEFAYWNFTTEPWKISVRQYQMLTELILDVRKTDEESGKCEPITLAAQSGSTSRPPQPLNGRNVVKYCSFS